MLSCKDVSRLVSESRDRSLGCFERLGIQIHLWICVNCRRFVKHLDLLGKALQRLETDEHCCTHGPCLSADAKQRIRSKLHH